MNGWMLLNGVLQAWVVGSCRAIVALLTGSGEDGEKMVKRKDLQEE